MKKILLLAVTLLTVTQLSAQDDEFNLDKSYAMNLSGTIVLKTSDADITITGSDRTDVRVKVMRNIKTKGWTVGNQEFSVEVEERGGNLEIIERSSGSHVSFVGYMSETYKIDIEAPRGVNLDLDGDDDDYFISNIDGDIMLDLDDGDADFKNCNGRDFSFNLDDGDIRMDKAAGRLSVRMDDGDLEIDNAAFTRIDATVNDGDIKLATTLEDEGDYYIRGDDAGLYIVILGGGGRFDIRHDDTRVSAGSGFEFIREKEEETVLELAGGNAKFTIRTDDSNIRFTKE
ncbi:DUF4097 family beta strand repeat-containing protein [Fulvivirga lutimaris]|uniref:DUF4097 family beta strand repeat-containing protein n=1 Tax=Fulvivirga lutimaris TaxID=1819566 RepID=UPI0012BC0D5A|nr:DUF4097 family beta strand repeat-containing protein [Fulvivirga lutimaris]MTI41166.1 hypothetical protein [Fulvivirga lutimaris]